MHSLCGETVVEALSYVWLPSLGVTTVDHPYLFLDLRFLHRIIATEAQAKYNLAKHLHVQTSAIFTHAILRP